MENDLIARVEEGLHMNTSYAPNTKHLYVEIAFESHNICFYNLVSADQFEKKSIPFFYTYLISNKKEI